MSNFGMRTFDRWWRAAFAVSLLSFAAASCGSNSSGAGDGAPGAGNESPAPVGSAVGDFVQFADADFAGADVDYVAAGLRRLAGAVGALGLGPAELPTDLRVAAEHLLLSPTSEAASETARAALVSAAGSLDQAQGGGRGLARLAESLSPDVPLPDQRAQIRALFQACARAAHDLSGGG